MAGRGGEELKFSEARMPAEKLCHKKLSEHVKYRFLHPHEAPRFFMPINKDKINNWWCGSCCHYAAVCKDCLGWCGGEAPFPGVYYLDRCGCSNPERGILIVSYCCPGGEHGGQAGQDKHGFAVHCIYCGAFGATERGFIFVQGLPVCMNCAHEIHNIQFDEIQNLKRTLHKSDW